MRLEYVKKVYGDGKHNAFTDMVSWRGAYYLTFRHASGHLSTDGEIWVLRSEDLQDWKKVFVHREKNDCRDPKFIEKENELIVTFPFCWCKDHVHDDTSLRGMKACMMSANGQWSGPVEIYEHAYTFWRAVRIAKKYYVAAYCVKDAWFVDLLVSDDGFSWKKQSRIYTGDRASETELFLLADSSLLAAVRREKDPRHICLARSRPPYDKWEHKETGVLLQGPAMGMVGKNLYLLGRHWKDDVNDRKVTFFRIDGQTLAEEISLPSRGDMSYAKILPIDERTSLVSYYSSHEDPDDAAASIFLAKISV